MRGDLGADDLAARPFRLLVSGVGGAGCRAVRRMDPAGADVVAIHTDAQVLATSGLPREVQIGAALTHGASTGGDVDLGRQAAEADAEGLRLLFRGYDLVVFHAGLGGGTGSGALPVLVRLARESSC